MIILCHLVAEAQAKLAAKRAEAQAAIDAAKTKFQAVLGAHDVSVARVVSRRAGVGVGVERFGSHGGSVVPHARTHAAGMWHATKGHSSAKNSQAGECGCVATPVSARCVWPRSSVFTSPACSRHFFIAA